MCGIAGCFHLNNIGSAEIKQVELMNEKQRHRGPDDEGIYSDNNCILGHRRLSIIDLSTDGKQPFYSDDNRYILTYNGELYNYIEIRNRLEAKGIKFNTKTDTEVLLKAYIEYGEKCLNEFNGMFAFAIYDTLKKRIFIARDRFGIKPLYYYKDNERIYFASEIKALKLVVNKKTVNQQALFDYLVFNRTDVYDETFINEIKRLPKGSFLEVDESQFKITTWWDPESFLNKNENYSESQISEEIEKRFVESVKFRMRSDVPVGACLSGGLDSSILTGVLFDKKLTTDFPTFTAAFPGYDIDETKFIDILNRKYKFKNYRINPTAKKAFDNLNDFIYFNDEPTTNSSFYSQYEVMKLANQHGAVVLLDGQGGDESFAGYQYFHGFYLNGLLRKLKWGRFCIELIKNIFRNQDKSAYQTLVFQLLPKKMKKSLLYKQVPFIKRSFFDKYIDSSKIFNDFFNAPDLNTSIVRHFQYKLEHLLRSEDRNSMAFSIESRVPYLDHNVVEFLLGVDENKKIKFGQTKHLQKQALGKYTIDKILNRKDKIGFATPRDEWMKTEEWKTFTDKNYSNLQDEMPDIFSKNCTLPKVGFERWKINQLAVWHKML